jgi:type II secretory ATPase GspE/PulE/Tfp pilus assembly ATPase PilB-like protein
VGEREKRIGQILLEMELVDGPQIQEALALQRRQGGVLGEIFVRLGYAAREDVLLALASQIGMTWLDLTQIPLEAVERTFRWMKAEEVVFHAPQEMPEPMDPLTTSEPVAKLANLVLTTALDAEATEIRFELSRDQFRIRYRVDGVRYDMESPPRHLAPPLLERVRRLTGLSPDFRNRTVPAVFAGRRFRVEAMWIRTEFEESVILGFLTP